MAGYQLTSRAVDQLGEMLREHKRRIIDLERKLTNVSVRRHEANYRPAHNYLLKTQVNVPIPARNGSELGTAEAFICYVNADDEIVVTDRKLLVYNLYPRRIPASTAQVPIYFWGNEELETGKVFAEYVHGGYIAKTKTGGIGARSGNVLGSGTVEVYRIDETGNLVATGEERTVYNMADGDEGAVDADKFIQVKIETASFRDVVDVDPCVDE